MPRVLSALHVLCQSDAALSLHWSPLPSEIVMAELAPKVWKIQKTDAITGPGGGGCHLETVFFLFNFFAQNIEAIRCPFRRNPAPKSKQHVALCEPGTCYGKKKKTWNVPANTSSKQW